jgi:hypothetical protein
MAVLMPAKYSERDEELREFKQLYFLSARVAEELTKEQVLERARLLALHLADYRERFVVIPPSNLLELLDVTKITIDQAKLLPQRLLEASETDVNLQIPPLILIGLRGAMRRM